MYINLGCDTDIFTRLRLDNKFIITIVYTPTTDKGRLPSSREGRTIELTGGTK